MRVAGLILIVLGIVGLLYGGFSIFRTHKVAQVGSVKAYQTHRETYAIPPVIGGAALVGGVVLMLAATNRRTV